MGASSNFGNMFSVLGASVMLPFLPMTHPGIDQQPALGLRPVADPDDHVDEVQLAGPQPWDVNRIARFLLWMGRVSSIFDYAMFGVMLSGFRWWNPPAPGCSRPAGSLSRWSPRRSPST